MGNVSETLRSPCLVHADSVGLYVDSVRKSLRDPCGVRVYKLTYFNLLHKITLHYILLIHANVPKGEGGCIFVTSANIGGGGLKIGENCERNLLSRIPHSYRLPGLNKRCGTHYVGMKM